MSSMDIILNNFILGDTEAVGELVDHHKVDLYNLCYRLTMNRHDSDDLFQQTWVKAVRHSGRFRGGEFKSWLYRICVNQFKDDYRRRKLKRRYFQEEFVENESKEYLLNVVGADCSAEKEYERSCDQELLIQEINALPNKQRVPIVLHYFQQMRYEEIAKILRIPVGTVKSRINTAKKNLRTMLEGEIYG